MRCRRSTRWGSRRSAISNCERPDLPASVGFVHRTNSRRNSVVCCCDCSPLPVPAWRVCRPPASRQRAAPCRSHHGHRNFRPIVTPDALFTAIEAFRPRDPSAALAGLYARWRRTTDETERTAHPLAITFATSVPVDRPSGDARPAGPSQARRGQHRQASRHCANAASYHGGALPLRHAASFRLPSRSHSVERREHRPAPLPSLRSCA